MRPPKGRGTGRRSRRGRVPREESHCMRCGAALGRSFLHGRVRPLCPRCGWIHFKNPASASAVAIVRDGAIVLVKRRMPPYVGSWCLPSGYQEYDESPEEAAVREAKEETNLDVRLTGLRAVYFSTHSPQKHAVVHIYAAERVGGVMRPGDDASDVKEFPLDRLPARIAFRRHLEIIELLKKRERRRR